MSKYEEEMKQAILDYHRDSIVVIPDDASLRSLFAKVIGAGTYVSYHDPELDGIVFIDKQYVRSLVTR